MFRLLASCSFGDYRETVFYDRVKVEELSIAVLKNSLRLANCKDPCIVEWKDRFIYQYADKASIFINKLDGKIYSDVDNAESRRQAVFLLRLLHKYDLVLGYVRKQQHSKNKNMLKGWNEQ